MKEIFLFLSLFIVLSSCEDNDDETVFQSTEIDFTDIGRGGLNGNGAQNISQSNLLINNQTDWLNLITQMNSIYNVSNTFVETNIDFDSYSIIAIFLEVKPTGWDVVINAITDNENNITLSVEEFEYDTTGITQPYHIVKIPKTTKEIIVE